MPRKMMRSDPEPSGPDGTEPSEQGERTQDQPAVGRRRLLTGGGVVAAGGGGAGPAAAPAAPARAAPRNPGTQDAGHNPTTPPAPPQLGGAPKHPPPLPPCHTRR